MKDGVLLAVIRPEDPAKAIQEARAIAASGLTGKKAQAKLDEMLSHQRYIYRGIATTDPKVLLNHDRSVIEGDGLKPGDSFIPYEGLVPAAGELAVAAGDTVEMPDPEGKPARRLEGWDLEPGVDK